jgi:prepilin-type N-terminal cleavage/methylation domain-containing protein
VKAARRQAGFTLAELLMALAILALLMTAVGTAYKAAISSYQENEQLASVQQAARVVLSRLSSEIRTAEAVDSDTNRLTIIPSPNPDNVTEIEYELTGGSLYYRRTVGGTTDTYEVLSADGDVAVDAFTVSREEVLRDELMVTRSVTVVLELHCGDNPFSLTASACPRRNLDF